MAARDMGLVDIDAAITAAETAATVGCPTGLGTSSLKIHAKT